MNPDSYTSMKISAWSFHLFTIILNGYQPKLCSAKNQTALLKNLLQSYYKLPLTF
jgi:hypothetical protein